MPTCDPFCAHWLTGGFKPLPVCWCPKRPVFLCWGGSRFDACFPTRSQTRQFAAYRIETEQNQSSPYRKGTKSELSVSKRDKIKDLRIETGQNQRSPYRNGTESELAFEPLRILHSRLLFGAGSSFDVAFFVRSLRTCHGLRMDIHPQDVDARQN